MSVPTPPPNTALEKATPAHTPGPWAVESAIGRDVISGNGKAVAQIEPWMQSEHKEANARLIAAAPELLDALKDAEEELRLLRMKDTQAVYNPGLRAKISLVIAKAGGQ